MNQQSRQKYVYLIPTFSICSAKFIRAPGNLQNSKYICTVETYKIVLLKAKSLFLFLNFNHSVDKNRVVILANFRIVKERYSTGTSRFGTNKKLP